MSDLFSFHASHPRRTPSRLSGRAVNDADYDPPAISAEEWHRRHEAKIVAMAGEADAHESEAMKQLKAKQKATMAAKRAKTRRVAKLSGYK